MVPGSSSCPTGTTRDYGGFLFANPGRRSEYICLDGEPEGAGNHDDNAGVQLSPVEGSGATMSVTNYTANRELTCAVCGSASNGSIFTRWGKGSCPTSTSLLYGGRMGGPPKAVATGGANYLCMASTPVYSTVNTADNGLVDARLTFVKRCIQSFFIVTLSQA